MEKKYKFKIAYASQKGYGSVDAEIKTDKVDSVILERFRTEIMEYLHSSNESLDPDSFFILGWSRIYD